MKNIVFFITHKTLSIEHAECTFRSMANQVTQNDQYFDALYIYNTHQDELSNSLLVDLFNQYFLNRIFKELIIFNYDTNTAKSLSGDVAAIKDFCVATFKGDDRVLLLKSDCVLSKNYFDDILNIPDGSIYYTAPFINAKRRVTNDEIFSYVERDTFVRSDDITFFVEGTERTDRTDFHDRPNVRVSDPQIKFTSCYVISDFSCHYISIGLLHMLWINMDSTWGGVNLTALKPYFVATNRSFVVHKFHEIVSENRTEDRGGPAADWLNS